jgi:hypothetical protein
MAKVLVLTENRKYKISVIDTGMAIAYIDQNVTILDPYGKLTNELIARGVTAIAVIETDATECDRLLNLPDYVPPVEPTPDWAGLSAAVEGSQIMATLCLANSIPASNAFYMLGDNINRESDRRVASADGEDGLAIKRIRFALAIAWSVWSSEQQQQIRDWVSEYNFPDNLLPN